MTKLDLVIFALYLGLLWGVGLWISFRHRKADSDFMIKCSPVASMVKKDIVGFIGVVLSGGAGLATLVPGL